MDIQEILLDYLAAQQGSSKDAVAELLFTSEGEDEKKVLKNDALQILLDLDKKRVEGFKTVATDEKTKIYDKAFAEAKKEILPKAEKKLAAQYGIEGENFKLDKLVSDIVAKEVEKVKGLGTEDVKKHPVFLEFEKSKNQEIDALRTEYDGKIEQINQQNAYKEVRRKAEKKVGSYFDDLKPILSKDSKKAANQKEIFVNRFLDNFTFSENGEDLLVLNSEGKRIEDGHGNPADLKTLVEKDASNYYDFAKQTEKGSPGNGGNDDNKTVAVPKTQEEYDLAILNASTPEERIAIADAYEAANA